MDIKIEPIKPHIGAVVHADRAALSGEGVAEQVLAALDEHDALVFPRLSLTDEEQLAFTDRLGARVNFTLSAPGGNAASADIYKVTLDSEINDEPEYVLGTFFWHMDGMPIDRIPPPKATLLSARRLAPKGGQTGFASTRAAYEALSAAERAELEGLRIVHSVYAGVRRTLRNDERPEQLKLGTVQGERPLVWTSATGVKSLLIGETADTVVGMPIAEGRALIARLLEWTVQPDFTYQHAWQEGDFVVWSNCAALHRVIPYDRDSGRTMHRTTVT